MLMRISLVPLFSLFFILIIFNLLGSSELILFISLKICRISFYFDEHLQRIMSPNLKDSRFGGDGQPVVFASEL